MNAPGGARGVSTVQENPKGAADLSQIRRFRLGQTLGRRPDAAHFNGSRRGRKRARGIEATPVAAAGRDEELRRGTPRGRGTCGVTTHAPGRWASSDPASRCFSPYVSERRERRPLRQTIASGAATHHSPVPEEVSVRRRNPMDGSGPRGREAGGEGTVEEVRNLEDGSCRGGNPPGGTDPSAHVVEGEENPRRGRSRP